LRERLEESLLPLAPGQIGRDKHFGVGSDGKMRPGVDTGTCRQNRSRPDQPPWMLGAEIDDTDDERFQHVLPLTKRIVARSVTGGNNQFTGSADLMQKTAV
jgi:hypothetical protein